MPVEIRNPIEIIAGDNPDHQQDFNEERSYDSAPPLLTICENPSPDEVPDNIEKLDSITRRQLRQDLLKGYGDPFSGDPQTFWLWQQQLQRRILESEAGYLDTLQILRANTIGRPKKLVVDLTSAGYQDPKRTLNQIWSTLRRRFGSNTAVSDSLVSKLYSFPTIKVHKTQLMEDLLDFARILSATISKCPDLIRCITPSGMREIWTKMPDAFQNRLRKAMHDREKRSDSFLNFDEFINQLEDNIEEVSMPNFRNPFRGSEKRLVSFDSADTGRYRDNQPNFMKSPIARKTLRSGSDTQNCIYHNTNGHDLKNCGAFAKLNFNEKKLFASDNKLCFACLGHHRFSECPLEHRCPKCSGKHLLIMHRDYPSRNGGYGLQPYQTKTNCINASGSQQSKSVSSKTMLVEVRISESGKKLKCLAILDEQSDTTFCHPSLIHYLKANYSMQNYVLSTMSGLRTSVNGKLVEGLSVRGVTEQEWIRLPPTLSNDNIPDSSHEVASPSIVASHSHIRSFARHFPNVDSSLEVLLLIGTDCGEAMKTKQFGSVYPFVHKTALGWALVGPVCPNNSSATPYAKSLKTKASSNLHEHFKADFYFDKMRVNRPTRPFDTFAEFKDYDLPGLSRGDQAFLDIVYGGFRMNNEEDKLQIPLPLKHNLELPNNRTAVFNRTKSTLTSLKKKENKLSLATKEMQKYMERNHVELVPTSELSNGKNFIPIFPVSHKKKEKIRIVFDSSASYNGISPNDVLYQGPDVNNKIIGVLTRFRHGKLGFSADIECMYHSFNVTKSDSDYLSFFRWKENNSNNPIVEYRSRVHNFGNRSSPAVACFGLIHTTTDDYAKQYPLACNFIRENSYVDDLLGGADCIDEAIQILENTRDILGRYSLRLHKIAASERSTMSHFPSSELSPDIDTKRNHL